MFITYIDYGSQFLVSMDEDFLSIKEYALLIRVHPNTVRRSIKNGHCKAFRTGRGCKAVYRIPRTEINRLALEHLETIIDKLIEKKIPSYEKKQDML